MLKTDMISRNGKIVIFMKISGLNKTITQFSIHFSSSLFMLCCFLECKAKFENLSLGLVKVVPKFSFLPLNNSILLLGLVFYSRNTYMVLRQHNR